MTKKDVVDAVHFLFANTNINDGYLVIDGGENLGLLSEDLLKPDSYS